MARKVRVRGIIPFGEYFLFVKHHHDDSFWALPGGKLEEGETLTAGLKRELIEELGVKPKIGKLLYVQQLFMVDHESLEFFFLVENGADYQHVNLDATTHGVVELARAEFISPATAGIKPEFLANLMVDMAADNLPKVFVRSAAAL